MNGNFSSSTYGGTKASSSFGCGMNVPLPRATSVPSGVLSTASANMRPLWKSHRAGRSQRQHLRRHDHLCDVRGEARGDHKMCGIRRLRGEEGGVVELEVARAVQPPAVWQYSSTRRRRAACLRRRTRTRGGFRVDGCVAVHARRGGMQRRIGGGAEASDADGRHRPSLPSTRGVRSPRAVHIDGGPPFLRRLFSFHSAAAAGAAAAAAAAAATGTSQPGGGYNWTRPATTGVRPAPLRRSTSHFFTPSHPLRARASRDAVPLEGSAAASEWHDGLHNADVVFAASPPPPLELLPQRGSISGGVAQGVSVGAATALLVASLFLGARSERIKERREATLELTRSPNLLATLRRSTRGGARAVAPGCATP